jgi:hypothetical protein
LQYDATYVFTVVPIIGNPTLLLAVSDTETWVNVTDGTTYNHISNNAASTATEQIVLTFDMRLTDSINCDFGGYPLNGGNTLCRNWIGVYCAASCVYNISAAIQGQENQTNIPRYLLADEYYTGKTTNKTMQYFYFPVNNLTGETAIILNKTGSLGSNGDSVIVVSL